MAKKQHPAALSWVWLRGLGLVLMERWSWVRILLDLRIFFFLPLSKLFSKLFGGLVCRYSKALKFRPSLILYNHLYSYLHSTILILNYHYYKDSAEGLAPVVFISTVIRSQTTEFNFLPIFPAILCIVFRAICEWTVDSDNH